MATKIPTKKHKPLSLAKTIKESAVWIEIPSQNVFEPAIIKMSRDYPYPIIAVLGLRDKPKIGSVDKNTYGIEWRCWLGRPSEEDMAAAQWPGRPHEKASDRVRNSLKQWKDRKEKGGLF